jgi:hypothetical protein
MCFAVDVSGSNTEGSPGLPASDPGPVYVRAEVVGLYATVLRALGLDRDQEVGFVTFGTTVGESYGPVALSGRTAVATLEHRLASALAPSPALAAWTDFDAAVSGCKAQLARAGSERGTVALLSDGYPEGPAGGPSAQLAAIGPVARALWSHGGRIDTVLYGPAAAGHGTARRTMATLAGTGHGRAFAASGALAFLEAGVSLASQASAEPLGGTEVAVDGSAVVPVALPAGLASAAVVALRSSPGMSLRVEGPGGAAMGTLGPGAGGAAVVAATDRPGSCSVLAQGSGSVYVAEMVRTEPVRTEPVSTGPVSSGTTSSGALGAGPVAAPRAAGLQRPRATSPATLTPETRARRSRGGVPALPVAGGLLVAAVAAAGAWLATHRKKPRGALVAWSAQAWRALGPADVRGTRTLAGLLGDWPDPEAASYQLRWGPTGPVLTGPGGEPQRLWAAMATDLAGGATALTWYPEGYSADASGEPPGRPVGAGPLYVTRQ